MDCSERCNVAGKVIPAAIDRLDQFHLLLSSPTFDLFLAGYCSVHILHRLVVDETSYLVFPREPSGLALFVFANPSIEVVRDTCVENA